MTSGPLSLNWAAYRQKTKRIGKWASTKNNILHGYIVDTFYSDGLIGEKNTSL